jgi:hypothetical protein
MLGWREAEWFWRKGGERKVPSSSRASGRESSESLCAR